MFIPQSNCSAPISNNINKNLSYIYNLNYLQTWKKTIISLTDLLINIKLEKVLQIYIFMKMILEKKAERHFYATAHEKGICVALGEGGECLQ